VLAEGDDAALNLPVLREPPERPQRCRGLSKQERRHQRDDSLALAARAQWH
jgi:hypothetical protein